MPTLTLHAPLCISHRLLPAVRVGDGWVSWDPSTGTAHIDAPGIDYSDSTMRPGLSGRTGAPEERIAACLGAFLSFLGACAESRSYGARMHKDPMRGENSDLFPDEVGEWAEMHSDEIGMLACELENPEGRE